MKFGDTVLVAFPFTDQAGSKLRPAVVVSNEAFHANKLDITLCAITSVLNAEQGIDVAIAGKSPEIEAAGLKYPSLIKTRKIITIEKKLILRSLGSLTPAQAQELKQGLRRYLGL